MENVLVVHLIAETHTNSCSRLAGVVAATRFWAELHNTINDVMRPHIVYKSYSFARKQRVLCCTIGRIQFHRVIRIVRTSWSWCIDIVCTK